MILRSEANLVASMRAPWTPQARAAAATVLTRIAAEEEARTSSEIRAAFDPSRLPDLAAVAQEFEATLPYGAPHGPELVMHCPAGACVRGRRDASGARRA